MPCEAVQAVQASASHESATSPSPTAGATGFAWGSISRSSSSIVGCRGPAHAVPQSVARRHATAGA
eukprot:1055114-Alexandrium_andersonii.AAC.1